MSSKTPRDAPAVLDSNAPPMTPLDRRRFIAAALAFTAGALTWQPSLAGAPVDDGAAATAALLAPLGEPAAAARIGAAYLAAYPEEGDLDRLVLRLRHALRMDSRAAPAGAEALLTALTELVQQEYSTAPLVRADGWLLAPTEARLYALAALARGSARSTDLGTSAQTRES